MRERASADGGRCSCRRLLSIGIDSAAVVAFMTRHSAHPVQTFSIGSSVDSRNELPTPTVSPSCLVNHHPLLD